MNMCSVTSKRYIEIAPMVTIARFTQPFYQPYEKQHPLALKSVKLSVRGCVNSEMGNGINITSCVKA